MIGITGWNSKIAQEFRNIAPGPFRRVDWQRPELQPSFNKFLLCHGLLYPKRVEDQTPQERHASAFSNCSSFIALCSTIIEKVDNARICIIGSESGYRGSFDGSYAAAKSVLHRYVRETVLRTPEQQLVAISPSIIGDCGMTTRRDDLDNLERRKSQHPRGRFLTAAEVASMAKFLLYDQPYVTGTVVRMHGGNE